MNVLEKESMLSTTLENTAEPRCLWFVTMTAVNGKCKTPHVAVFAVMAAIILIQLVFFFLTKLDSVVLFGSAFTIASL